MTTDVPYHSALEQQIDRLSDPALISGERGDVTDHCLANVARLSNEVNEANVYLPVHDQRIYAEKVKALRARLDKVRAAAQPKQRFSFKLRQKNSSATYSNDAANLAKSDKLHKPSGNHIEGSGFSNTPQSLELGSHERELSTFTGPHHAEPVSRPEEPQDPALQDVHETVEIRKHSFLRDDSVVISNHVDLHIVLPSSASTATSSGVLSQLRHCVVDTTDSTSHGSPFAGLTLKNVKNSLLVCGQVSGPIHVTGLEDTVLVVSCRQFRMHESKNCAVYLLCTSRPIIEHSHGIKFAPIPRCYVSLLCPRARWERDANILAEPGSTAPI